MSKIIIKIMSVLQSENVYQLVRVQANQRKLSFIDERLDFLKDVNL
jgi:hypothetical protein